MYIKLCTYIILVYIGTVIVRILTKCLNFMKNLSFVWRVIFRFLHLPQLTPSPDLVDWWCCYYCIITFRSRNHAKQWCPKCIIEFVNSERSTENRVMRYSLCNTKMSGYDSACHTKKPKCARCSSNNWSRIGLSLYRYRCYYMITTYGTNVFKLRKWN